MPRTAQEMPSDKMQEVYRFIINYVEEKGFQPSVAEMAAAFDVTEEAIIHRLNGLASRKFVILHDGYRNRQLGLPHIHFKAFFLSSAEREAEAKKTKTKKK